MTPPNQGSGAFDAPRSREVLGVVITFTITSSLSIALRLIAKRIQRLRLAAEDWTIIAAQIAVYGMATCSILEITLGGAGHPAATQPEKVPAFLKILIAMQVFYGTTLGLIKISICLFFNRIFALPRFRKICWTVIAIITAWSIMVILTAFLLCTPLAFNWDPTTPGGRCGNQPVAFIVIGVLDLLVDAMVFALPIPLIWNLQVSLANKIALLAIFGVGISTMIISGLRIHALLSVSYADITFTAAKPLLWSFSEPAIGISVACAPLLRPLFRNGRPGQTSSQKDGKKSKASDAASFHRLHDSSYPLRSLAPNQTTITSREWESPDNSIQGDIARSWETDHPVALQPTVISVKREWQMERS